MNFYKYARKGYKNVKGIKWYWREKFIDIEDDTSYRGYTVKRHEEPSGFQKIELIPKDYDKSVIWLYDGDYLEMMIENILEHNNFPPKNFKLVFYRAPFNPITHNSAVLQHSWFNIFDLPDSFGNRDIDKSEIDRHNKLIHREIKDQYNVIGKYDDVYIGGYSQSGCMALYATMSYPDNLGGVFCFNGFNFTFTPVDKEKKSIPIVAVNGKDDEVVIPRHARESYSVFKKHDFKLTYVEEPGLYHAFTKSGLSLANSMLENKLI
jgi:predicted esterase